MMAPHLIFFEFLSTLARYTGLGFHLHIKTGNYVKHLSITFQNLKTELKNILQIVFKVNYNIYRDLLCNHDNHNFLSMIFLFFLFRATFILNFKSLA